MSFSSSSQSLSPSDMVAMHYFMAHLAHFQRFAVIPKNENKDLKDLNISFLLQSEHGRIKIQGYFEARTIVFFDTEQRVHVFADKHERVTKAIHKTEPTSTEAANTEATKTEEARQVEVVPMTEEEYEDLQLVFAQFVKTIDMNQKGKSTHESSPSAKTSQHLERNFNVSFSKFIYQIEIQMQQIVLDMLERAAQKAYEDEALREKLNIKRITDETRIKQQLKAEAFLDANIMADTIKVADQNARRHEWKAVHPLVAATV